MQGTLKFGPSRKKKFIENECDNHDNLYAVLNLWSESRHLRESWKIGKGQEKKFKNPGKRVKDKN